MAWSESGLYVENLFNCLTQAVAIKWNLGTHKLYLTGVSDTPDYTQSAASAIYSVTNEVSGTNWAAGGTLLSANGAGTPTVTQSPTKSVMWDMGDISVATTTISTAAYGGFIYQDALSPKAKLIGIYFGGSGYTTVAGTFAITWNALGVAVIKCAVSGA